MSPVKPLLRGRFHQFAFYTTIFLTCTYFALALFSHLPFRLPILIYLISQLTSYGVSATYHLFNFKTTRTKRLFQQLDHASIFLLISGTQTCVITTFIPISIASNLLIVSWTITLIGIFKVIFLNVREVVDVIFYICHGVCIIPFVKKMALYLGAVQWVFIITGGVLYIIGGIVFGAEKPNPWPKVVGYHEIFHVLTIIANYCFMIPVVSKYLCKE